MLRCHARGWLQATSGNFSLRADADSFLISASGLDKGRLTEADLGQVWLDGRVAFAPGQRPSAETPLHAALYARDPAIGAIAHTHSVAATVLSRAVEAAGQASLELTGWEMAKGLRGVTTHQARVRLPVVGNDQDTTRLAASVGAVLGDAPGYLIAGHGLYTWGRDVAEAARHVEALEFLLECELQQRRSS
ncbi:MAG: methylthioribulose 1-phosphate dehydratase [Deltaproteobacteria bacterium]|nr:methylthioribulose 1-phosphate dehydratase [Deltaproteobacteria bacterium]